MDKFYKLVLIFSILTIPASLWLCCKMYISSIEAQRKIPQWQYSHVDNGWERINKTTGEIQMIDSDGQWISANEILRKNNAGK